MHPNETYVNETWPGTWPVNNLEPGSSSNSVPSLWTDASQVRLLKNQHFNSMYPRYGGSSEQHYPIENQHLNSVYSEGAEGFYLIDNVQVNPMYPGLAVAGECYLFANQQISHPEGTFPGELFGNIDNGQVDSVYPDGRIDSVYPDGRIDSVYPDGRIDSVYPDVAVKGEQFYDHDLCPKELTDCSNQFALESADFPHSYHNDVWPSQAGGGEGASSSASVLSSVSAFSCQTVCSTPEPDASLSPIATDPSADKSWLLPADHRFASPEVATSDYEVTKKKKARKCQCEVRISKKLPKSNDMLKQKLWITFDEAEQAQRARRVATYLLSGSKTKYMDTPFDPEFEREIRALRHAVQANGVTTDMYCKVKELADRYGKHGAT